MDKRHPNHQKTKDKSQASNSAQLTRPKGLVKKDENHSGNCKVKKHNVPYSMHEPKVCQDSARYWCIDEDDEYVCSTSDFLKPFFEKHKKNKSFQSKNHFEGTMKEKIFSSVNQYKTSKDSFSKIYHKWLPERQDALAKLRSLLKEVHDNATKYYKTQATFKELSYNSRSFRETTRNETADFFTSFTAFLSDAASGISSFAQAFEMDSYQTTFQEIMDHDAEITKDLYDCRSQCLLQYQGIEEVIKKFHSITLTATVDKISDTLHVDKHWGSMKNAYQKNDMPKLLDEVCKFFDNACQSDVLENVSHSVQKYVSDNPAAFDACKSTGRAVYGAIDAFRDKKKDSDSVVGCINKATNLYLMSEDKKEIDRLKSIIGEDSHQSKLESKIEEAIDSLESEMKEMNDLYFQLFNIYDSD